MATANASNMGHARIKSIQAISRNELALTSTQTPLSYADITIAAVNVAKTVLLLEGNIRNSNVDPNNPNVLRGSAMHLLNSTTVRVSVIAFGATTMRATFSLKVVEYA